MANHLPTPENFPAPGSTKKFEREQKEQQAAQEKQAENLDDAVSQGLDKAQVAADIFADNINSYLQAVQAQGAILKQSDHQLLNNLINQSKAATANLQSTLSQLSTDTTSDIDMQSDDATSQSPISVEFAKTSDDPEASENS
ncbi:MAG: hypothetical protein V1898_04985 [Patescibacteria group bacterium]